MCASTTAIYYLVRYLYYQSTGHFHIVKAADKTVGYGQLVPLPPNSSDSQSKTRFTELSTYHQHTMVRIFGFFSSIHMNSKYLRLPASKRNTDRVVDGITLEWFPEQVSATIGTKCRDFRQQGLGP